MKIYTKTGDFLVTSICGKRVKKSHPMIDLMGDIDEFSCTLGLFSDLLKSDDDKHTVLSIQKNLYVIAGQISMPIQRTQTIAQSDIQTLETAIDAITDTLPPLKDFIIPAGAAPVPQIHFARAVCRRMERSLCDIELAEMEKDAVVVTAYVNRVSDYLFTLARKYAALNGEADVAAKRVE
jgi:cob(I)alamin adenosyltransferase